MSSETFHQELHHLTRARADDVERIDGLVADVADVKAGMKHAVSGIDELKGAMTTLAKHATVMEHVVTDIASIRKTQADQETRLRTIEIALPALQDVARWVKAGLGVVVLAVLGALVALVVKQ